jgi:hypothetical protein
MSEQEIFSDTSELAPTQIKNMMKLFENETTDINTLQPVPTLSDCANFINWIRYCAGLPKLHYEN